MGGELTCTRKGYYRDRAIVEAVEQFGILDTEQIARLFFTGSQGQRVAQRRLKGLTDKGKLNRCRESIDLPCWYYTGKRPKQAEHRLAVNWVYTWLFSKLKQWERLESFEHEPDYKTVRPDALAAIRNTVTGKMRLYFIEADMSGNGFDKASKYNRLFATSGYGSAWWAESAERFPAILIVTEGEGRRRTIAKRIEKENSSGLEFQVHLLDEIKREAMR